MKKKLISILFLTAILFVSCSNENKTGPSSNNNNDLKYSGSWTFTNTPNYKGGVLIMKSFLLHIRTYIIISLFLFLSEITATSIILLFPGLLIDSFINNKLSLINMIILYIVTYVNIHYKIYIITIY